MASGSGEIITLGFSVGGMLSLAAADKLLKPMSQATRSPQEADGHVARGLCLFPGSVHPLLLGPPVVLFYRFFFGGGFPCKIDYRKSVPLF